MLTKQRVDDIFKEMDVYVLELANDPTALGPHYFQDIIATCRNYLNKVSLIVTEINRERLAVSAELRKLEAVYALEHDDLLANNERVRYLASVEDRKATVNFLLRDQQKQINDLKDQMHQLDAVYKVVSYRNRELHATMAAIKDQRRLVKIEVDSGSFYGDERVPRGYRSPSGAMDVEDIEDLSEAELAEMVSGSEEEGKNLPVESVRKEEIPQPMVVSEETATSDSATDSADDILSILDEL